MIIEPPASYHEENPAHKLLSQSKEVKEIKEAKDNSLKDRLILWGQIAVTLSVPMIAISIGATNTIAEAASMFIDLAPTVAAGSVVGAALIELGKWSTPQSNKETTMMNIMDAVDQFDKQNISDNQPKM